MRALGLWWPRMSIGDQSVLEKEKEPSESSGVGAASAHISCGGIAGAGSAQMSSFSSSDGTDGAGSAHMSLALVGGGGTLLRRCIAGAGSAQMSSFSSSDGTAGAGSAHMSLALAGGGGDGGGDGGGGVVSFGVR